MYKKRGKAILRYMEDLENDIWELKAKGMSMSLTRGHGTQRIV
jgi:hypothetical protein